jgi:hypothetical protein
MRSVIAGLFVLAACGGPQQKKESSIVEGADVPATCCCKTLPETAEKEIVPSYKMEGRMECSTQHGDCVPDVQCNGSQQPAESTPAKTDNGVPPPPDLTPSK